MSLMDHTLTDPTLLLSHYAYVFLCQCNSNQIFPTSNLWLLKHQHCKIAECTNLPLLKHQLSLQDPVWEPIRFDHQKHPSSFRTQAHNYPCLITSFSIKSFSLLKLLLGDYFLIVIKVNNVTLCSSMTIFFFIRLV